MQKKGIAPLVSPACGIATPGHTENVKKEGATNRDLSPAHPYGYVLTLKFSRMKSCEDQ